MDYDSPTLWHISGEIESEDMDAVEAAIEGAEQSTRIYRSGFDGHLEVTVEAAGLFEIEYRGGPDDGGYLFGGSMEPSNPAAIALLTRMSQKLGDGAFRHRFECYEGDRLALYLHHEWPRIG